MDERMARMGLSCAVEPAHLAVASLLDSFGAQELWTMLRAGRGHVAWARRAAAVDFGQIQSAMEQHQIRFLIPGDAEWPSLIDDLVWAEVGGMGGIPVGLWVVGSANLAYLSAKSVAIVGSRASSHYGDELAGNLASQLASSGVTVVSGGAFGIDAAAHRGALGVSGPTLAVLAGGLDQRYPPGNAVLLDRVAESGLLVSEMPPGANPTRARFLTRNRLIAGLSLGTVLVEAAVRSGARNTVSWSVSMNRPIGAVPGSIFSATSVTPHRLIRDGEAVLVSTGDEVLSLIAPLLAELEPAPPRGEDRDFDRFSATQQTVFEALPGRGEMSTDEVSMRAGVPIRTTLVTLEELRQMGVVDAVAGDWRLARRAAS